MTFTGVLIGFLLTIHVIVSVLLVLIILMQRPKSEGLGTAFGGGVTDSLFGSSAGNVLTKITTWLGIIFFLTTISLALLYSRVSAGKKSDLGARLGAASAAATNADVHAAVTNLPSATAAPVSTNAPAK
ncbi:MAG: preprotein translocase subunit SecG [Verrucomicrobiae bacterium]|nr:preprotein translocase subunit SecG [Verrucomicrobiae bacterium]